MSNIIRMSLPALDLRNEGTGEVRNCECYYKTFSSGGSTTVILCMCYGLNRVLVNFLELIYRTELLLRTSASCSMS